MRIIDKGGYGRVAIDLIDKADQEQRPSSLPIGSPVPGVREVLVGLNEKALGNGGLVIAPDFVACLKSALWLRFDYFDESHAFSQDVHSASGSYWHGILHRREPDAGNARYWFSKVGEHDIFSELVADAREISGADATGELADLVGARAWDPDLFIKLCTSNQDRATTELLLKIQRREWALLYDHDFRRGFQV